MNYQIVILAAGKGTRMKSELPKVLVPFAGSTMIESLLEHLDITNAANMLKPLVVVGYQSEKIKTALGNSVEYVTQTDQLGTGHAVQIASSKIDDRAEVVVVLYGDHPLVDKETVNTLITSHVQSSSVVTMGTIIVNDFDDWRSAFEFYGRVVRDDVGQVIKIVEHKDADEQVLALKEINPAYFIFDKTWLIDNLKQIENNNAQKEYYLTDLVSIAQREGEHINTVAIPPETGLGANTQEQLEFLESRWLRRKK